MVCSVDILLRIFKFEINEDLMDLETLENFTAFSFVIDMPSTTKKIIVKENPKFKSIDRNEKLRTKPTTGIKKMFRRKVIG